jgi:carboxypeptidase family protein
VRPFTVTGVLRFDAPLRKPVMNCSVYLRPLDDDDSAAGPTAASSAQVDRFGNFQWTGVMPGTYVAQFNGDDVPELYLKYVRIGASNADGSFRLTGPASVEVVVSPRSATLEGMVIDGHQPASNATVVVVPEEKYRKLPERFHSGATDQNGHFTIRGLAPGSYTVFAWHDLDEDLYRDPAFLKSQESNGMSINIGEESRQKIQLNVSPMGEEWQ